MLNPPYLSSLKLFFRFVLLYGILSVYACGVPSSRSDSAAPSPTDSSAEQVFEETRVAFRLNQMGDSVRNLDDYAGAIHFYQLAMDSALINEDSFGYYDAKLDLACVYDRMGHQEKSVEMAEDIIKAYVRSGDSSRLGRAYSTMASFFKGPKMPPKNMEAAQRGFDILKLQGDAIHRCAAYNQMAFTYSGQGRWAEALPLLDTALLWMYRSGVLDQRALVFLNLGNCHRNLGNWAQATAYLRRAEVVADSFGQGIVAAKAVERLSQIAEATGKHAEALQLYRRAVARKDSIFTAEKTKNMQDLEVRYHTREKEQEINLLHARQATADLERKMAWLLLGMVIVVSLGLYLRMREKWERSRRELENNSKTLQTFAQMMLQKNAQIREMENALVQYRKTPLLPAAEDAPAEQRTEILEEFDIYNNRILTNKDWETFKYYFEQAHKGYLLRLRTAYPDLSDAEERLFLLLKMNFNSQEISAILGISADSVKKGRQRLRKRLQLDRDTNLEQFIRQY